ncbi:MAG: hypothetical protein R3323_07755 [Wenzhouxiangellaceae bacterium]|nr:hypothetical protein [Wenzhouxiangellaceae bacterium]
MKARWLIPTALLATVALAGFAAPAAAGGYGSKHGPHEWVYKSHSYHRGYRNDGYAYNRYYRHGPPYGYPGQRSRYYGPPVHGHVHGPHCGHAGTYDYRHGYPQGYRHYRHGRHGPHFRGGVSLHFDF